MGASPAKLTLMNVYVLDRACTCPWLSDTYVQAAGARLAMVNRLADRGLIEQVVKPGLRVVWVTTDAGRRALASPAKSPKKGD